MAEVYEYRAPGSRPLTLAGWGVALVLIALAARGGASSVLWGLWALSTGCVSWHLYHNPPAGCRIGAGRWQLWLGRRRIVLDCDQIALVGLGPVVTVQFRDGSRRRLPAGCLPPAATLVRCLARSGVATAPTLPDAMPAGQQAAPLDASRA